MQLKEKQADKPTWYDFMFIETDYRLTLEIWQVYFQTTAVKNIIIKPLPPNNSKSNIKDQWSQITITNIIIMKKFEILQELPKYDSETQNEQMLLEKQSQ